MAVVSVVLPCFNAASFILSSIQSILDQTYDDWELIVVDDASTDQSVKLVVGIHDKRVKLVKLSKNGGYPVAMNIGIAQAKGKYIARMDADDVCLPSRFEEQLTAMSSHPQASFCGINRFRITPGGMRYVDREIPTEPYRWETWHDLVGNNRLFTDPSVMISKEKVLAVGGYRTFQRSGMDVDLWLRVMERYGPCVTITKPLYGKRLEPGSLVFKPETPLINQVPRALALQRKNRGADDIMDGRPINLLAYLNDGLIRPVQPSSAVKQFVGAAATCAVFSDRLGFWIYFRKAWSSSSGPLNKIRVLWLVLVKLTQRLRDNPYRLYTE